MRARIPEKVVQSQITQALRAIGAKVRVLGHPTPNDGRRFRGTGQSLGLPDLLVFFPAPRYAPTWLWVEVKAKGGRLRPEQLDFRLDCIQTKTPHVVGGLDAVLHWLIEQGYVKRESVAWYRMPKEAAGA